MISSQNIFEVTDFCVAEAKQITCPDGPSFWTRDIHITTAKGQVNITLFMRETNEENKDDE